MNDDEYAELFRPRKPGAETTWQDVAREFQTLGKTLGEAFRAAWQRPPDDAGQLSHLQEALQGIVDEVNGALDRGASSPEAEEARAQLTRLTESIRQAADRAGDQLRPELLSLLRQANAELRRLTGQDPAD